MDAPITDRAKRCLLLLDELIEQKSVSGEHRAIYEEQSAGFKLWGRTMAVFQPNTSQIEYILRHNLSTQRAILELVKAVLANLSLCAKLEGIEIASNVDISTDLDSRLDTRTKSDKDSVASSSSSESSQSLENKPRNKKKELHVSHRSATRSINDSIDLLIRISILVHQHGAAKIDTKANKYYPSDLAEFKIYAENAIRREFGVTRFDHKDFIDMRQVLVQSVVERWRRISYRIKQTKTVPIEDDEGSISEPDSASDPTFQMPAAAAGSRMQLPQTGSAARPARSEAARSQSNVRLSSVAPSFTLSKVPVAKTPGNSRAGSLAEAKDLDIPLPPAKVIEDFRKTRRGFLCPYCRVLQRFDPSKRQLWREHVMHDLAPYFCLHVPCHKAGIIFDDSKSWTQHMKFEHTPRIWRCYECTRYDEGPLVESELGLAFESEKDFIEHMTQGHSPPLTAEEILTLAKHGVRRHALVLSQCMICGRTPQELGISGDSDSPTTANTQEALYGHMHRHLQSFALISLPWDAGDQIVDGNLSEVAQDAQSTDSSNDGAAKVDMEDPIGELRDVGDNVDLLPDTMQIEPVNLSEIRTLFSEDISSRDKVAPWRTDTEEHLLDDTSTDEVVPSKSNSEEHPVDVASTDKISPSTSNIEERSVDITSNDWLLKAMENAQQYPLNLSDRVRDRSGLQDLRNRLLRHSRDLFCAEPEAWDTVSFEVSELLRLDEGWHYSRFQASDTANFLHYLERPILQHRPDPHQRIFYINAAHSRAKLNINQRMFLQLLTYHTVMPAFLECIMPFGRRLYPNFYDMYQSIRFRSENYFTSARGPSIPALGRTGHFIQLCYNLASVEESVGDVRLPYSLRICAIYHSLDLQSMQSTWIIIKGNQLIAERVKHELAQNERLRARSSDDDPPWLAMSLNIHTFIAAWASENWQSYFQGLEASVGQEGEYMKSTLRTKSALRTDSDIRPLQQLGFVEEKLSEAVSVLMSNLTVLTDLANNYRPLIDLDALLTSSDLNNIHEFLRRIDNIQRNMQACAERGERLLVSMTRRRSAVSGGISGPSDAGPKQARTVNRQSTSDGPSTRPTAHEKATPFPWRLSNSSLETQDFLQALKKESVISCDIPWRANLANNETRIFIPEGRTRNMLWEPENNFNRIRNLLRAESGTPPDLGPRAHPRDIAQHCSKVFCILVLIEKVDFIDEFVMHKSLWDDALPFDRGEPYHFPSSPKDPGFFQKFFASQWQFCALEIRRNYGFRVQPEFVIPFTEAETIAKGPSSTIYKVKIQPEHDVLETNMSPSHTYAIKTFRGRGSEKNFEREAKAFRQVTDAARITPGLTECYGTFEYRGVFAIVLEYADGGTLEDFFQQEEPPDPGEQTLAFWNSIFLLLTGLSRIHEERRNVDNIADEGSLLRVWHQDLKPKNILVSRNEAISDFPWSFKIADLGTSHFESVLGKGEAQDIDYFGTITYGAPEAYQVRHQAVTEKLDIWSLGCIFSEVCVWISRGHKGLTDFRKMRKEAGSSIPGFQGGNCFHNGFRMQEQVSEYLIDLKAKLQERDDVGGMVLDRMVFEMLEEEPTMRPSTYQLRGDSLELIRVAKDKLGQTSWPQKSLQKQTALDSRDDQLSNTSHLEPEEIATTVKVSPGVAYCSLEEAERWYNRRKSGDTNAELPDHNLLLELKDRKHVFFVDDSRSMAEHWPSVAQLAQLLTYIIKQEYSDGIEIYFLSSSKVFKTKKATAVKKAILSHQPGAKRDLHGFFREYISDYVSEIEQAEIDQAKEKRRRVPGISRNSPMAPARTVYVLTDGIPAGDKLKFNRSIKFPQVMLPPRHLGIQFILFGKGPANLDAYPEGFAETVNNVGVDLEPCHGNVWKMLLGALNGHVDASSDADDAASTRVLHNCSRLDDPAEQWVEDSVSAYRLQSHRLENLLLEMFPTASVRPPLLDRKETSIGVPFLRRASNHFNIRLINDEYVFMIPRRLTQDEKENVIASLRTANT